MKTPFPGMDPYLEQKGIWNQVHTSLITDIQRALAPLVQPNYRVIIEQLTYVSLEAPNGEPKPPIAGRPDNLIISPRGYQPGGAVVAAAPPVKPVPATLPVPEQEPHRYLEIRDRFNELITVIEILSPTNKQGKGREQYLHKRHNVLNSLTHLVEIDLLRQGKPLPMEIEAENDYRLLVSRSSQQPVADVYLFSLREPIPPIPIPLREGDQEPLLELNPILHQVYELGYYATLIDYDQALYPPLPEEDKAWADALLQKRQESRESEA